jgi:WD40 repeat protein
MNNLEPLLEQLSSTKPSEELWNTVCDDLEELSPSEQIQAISVLQPVLQSWPEHLRVMPDEWWEQLLRGEDVPLTSLARLRILYSRASFEDDELFLALYNDPCCVDLNPNLGSFVIGDSGEYSNKECNSYQWNILHNRFSHLHTGEEQPGIPYMLTYSGSGTLIAESSVKDGMDASVFVWNAKSQQRLWEYSFESNIDEEHDSEYEGDSEHCIVAFDDDETMLFALSCRHGQLLGFDAQRGKRLYALRVPVASRILTLSQDKSWIATASETGNVIVWDRTTKQKYIEIPVEECRNVAFLPNGQIVTVSDVVQFWEWKNGSPVCTLEEPVPCDVDPDEYYMMGTMNVLPNGCVRLLGHEAGKIHILDYPHGESLVIQRPGRYLESLQLCCSGKYLLCANSSQVWLWLLPGGNS